MGFTMPHITILIGAGVIGLALLLQIIGLATPSWLTFEQTGITSKIDLKQGLWKYCQNDDCNKFSSSTDWLDACRAFGILAVLIIIASLACAVLTCFMAGQKLLPLVASIAAGVAALCILIEFAVYAGEITLGSYDYGYSFGLTIVACILCVGAAICFFLGHSKTAAQ